MNPDDIKRLFPNASASCLAANSGTATVVERATKAESLAANKTEEKHSGRFLIRVTSRRRRLLDEDNLAEKFHVDCLRYSGIIPSDTPECAHIEVSQEKISKGETEETVIEVFSEAIEFSKEHLKL